MLEADGVPAYDGPAGTVSDTRRAARVRDLPASSLVAGRGHPAAAPSSSTRATAWAASPSRSSSTGCRSTVVPLYFELDGTFPNHEANPIDPDNLRDLQDAVLANGADLGLAFDGDADRCFVVDERGEIVSPSTLTALIAVRELAREPGRHRSSTT